jgi:RTX calcium-binding nonapeptide repeat (4 copies)
MRTKLHLTATLAAACVAALLAALPAGADRVPTAGAPHDLHWGDAGLCKSFTDWDAVSGITFDPATRIVSVEGLPNAYDFLEVTVDTHGTASVWDDTLNVQLESYVDGPPDVEVLDPPVPLYDPGSNGGGGGDFTTANTPKKLYVRRIEFTASTVDTNGVTNDTPVPMYARGFFGSDGGGVDGFFLGGKGPDCVLAVTGKGAGKDNIIDARGGPDYVKTGFGDDSLSGGEGPDTIVAGSGDDVLRGGGDVDLLRGEADSDCYSGAQDDGLRDLLDDPEPGLGDINEYAAEPGVVGGVPVETIEYVTEDDPLLVVDCVG